jgi:hypothetical protein
LLPKTKNPRAFRRGDAVFHPQPASDPRPLSARAKQNRTACGQVFWLPDYPPAAPSRSDGLVKSPYAVLRFPLRHCGVRKSTPRSSGVARLASGAFYEVALRTVTSSGLCPRLQRRDRDGLAPSSLSPRRATRRDLIFFYYSPSGVSRGMSARETVEDKNT